MSTNGLLPTTDLTLTSAGSLLRHDAADAFERLAAHYRDDRGLTLRITEGYRDRVTQDRYWARSLEFVLHNGRWVQRRHLPFGHPMRFIAAVPGTSVHGWGLAADFAHLGGFTGTGYRWFLANAARFGWWQPFIYTQAGAAPEPWHWEYTLLRDTTVPVSVPVASVPTPPTIVLPDPVTPRSWFDMATKQDLRDVVDAALAERSTLVLYRLEGTRAAYRDLGTARRHITAEQAAGTPVRYVDLPATDSFWRLPLVGPPGEVYRRPGQPAAHVLELGTVRHVERPEYEALGRPRIVDLPLDHSLWSVRAA